MKRFQTLPSLLSALFLAGTFLVTGCNPGTISGPDFDAEYSVQTQVDTETFGIQANDRKPDEHNNAPNVFSGHDGKPDEHNNALSGHDGKPDEHNN